MTSLIIYDSVFGNTETIAKTIGTSLTTYGSSPCLRPSAVDLSSISSIDLLVIGSPTRGFPPMRCR